MRYLWRKFCTFTRGFCLWRSKETRVDIATALPEDAKGQALKEASFLFGTGVWVRDLLPGEVAKEEPEIGDKPLVAPDDIPPIEEL